MIKFALISLLLATGLAEITPLPSTDTIKEIVKMKRYENHDLQSFDMCSHIFVDTSLERLFGGTVFNCRCSDSGTAVTINCQLDEGQTICCYENTNDLCGTVQHRATVTYELAADEEVCMNFTEPADLEGQQRCGRLVSCGVGISEACSCEAKVNGQMCDSCDVCKQATLIDPYHCVAVDCTNIAGFENFSTDCQGYSNFFGFGACVPDDPCTAPSTSAVYPSTFVIFPASMATIIIAISCMLW